MLDILHIIWLVPILPFSAAIILFLIPDLQKRSSSIFATVAIILSFILSCFAFSETLNDGSDPRKIFNFTWFEIGENTLQIGWIIDPLSVVMLMMVSFVGMLIFIFSIGYMSSEKSFNRFFCYMSLFAGAMLGVIISNSLLLLFIFWEIMGLASYLLIGFWNHKTSATAAAQKAFITTRIGDLGLFIGMIWLYSASGTLLFFDNGEGCLEENALSALASENAFFGLTLLVAIPLFILWGAMGKSGQVPLHVWLPDAMEGPTPVSALIHAATMVAAGIFLLARIYPLLEPFPENFPENFSETFSENFSETTSLPLMMITWIGSITAFWGALLAVAQTDIKRILAYSTISQLGYMMLGLGTGGVDVAMFHLMTHAFFKALLFLGAGSVIHKCGSQDIRKMGGLARTMPITFITYAIGMLALSGFPLLFSGFWSKDAILHNAHIWQASPIPFYIGLLGVFLTAFYMSRQMIYVFFGKHRSTISQGSKVSNVSKVSERSKEDYEDYEVSKSSKRSKVSKFLNQKIFQVRSSHKPFEGSIQMLFPLIILAFGTIILSLFGTPFSPKFQAYLSGEAASFSWEKLFEKGTFSVMITSSFLALGGLAMGWKFYREKAFNPALQADPVEVVMPRYVSSAKAGFGFDALYRATLFRATSGMSRASDFLDRKLLHPFVELFAFLVKCISWAIRFVDDQWIEGLFKQSCRSIRWSSHQTSQLQKGQIQVYLKVLALSMILLTFLFFAFS